MTEAELLEEISGKMDVLLDGVALVVEFCKLSAWVAWSGVGYLAYRLLVGRNFTINHGQVRAK